MIQKIKSKKGFTLAELLIVVAIIGVLIAIAIPVFGSQLTAAQTRVEEANDRSASAIAVVENLKNGGTNANIIVVLDSANHNMHVAAAASTTKGDINYTVVFETTGEKAGTVKSVTPAVVS